MQAPRPALTEEGWAGDERTLPKETVTLAVAFYQRPLEAKWNDIWCAILWLLQLIVVLVLAAVRARGLFAVGSIVSIAELRKGLGYVAVLISVAIMLAIITMVCLRKWPRLFILGCNIANILVMIIVAIICIALGAWIFALIMAVIIVFNIVWLLVVKRRIPFASVMLETASMIVQKHTGLFWVSGFFTFISFAYYIVVYILVLEWFVNKSVKWYFILLTLLSFYWTTQVFRNLVHTITCSVTGYWYFNHATVQGATRKSMARICTKSLGSVCIGSLIVGILNVLKIVLRGQADGEAGVISCCLSCVVQIIDQLLQYFNEYAYSHVAIYGISYIQAARATWRLIRGHAVSAMINDSLIGTVFMLVVLVSGMICAGVGAAIGATTKISRFTVGGSIGGFLIGASVVMIFTSLMASCVITIFVCYAEHPGSLGVVHPVLYNRLKETEENNTDSIIYDSPTFPQSATATQTYNPQTQRSGTYRV